MLKVLLKKQFLEIFRRYFYDKNGKKLSPVSSVLLFVLFGLLVVVFLGGMFTILSISLCKTLADAELTWLYYAMIGLIAVLFGCFGSVFNTYSTLYLSKDNDFLLSLPIPVKTIMASRLVAVYLLGLLYSGVVTIPAAIVFFCVCGVSVFSFFGGVMFVVLTSFVVFTLSCLLGWLVSLVAAKLKNKSFVTVVVSIAFFALYYLVYFKAQELIEYIVSNAESFGGIIKIYAFPMFAFGMASEGNLLYLLCASIVVFGLLALTLYVMSRGFLKVVTSTASGEKTIGKIKDEKQKTPFFSLYRKETKRFTSSANYMLNSGFGMIIYVAFAVLLFVSRDMIIEMFSSFGYPSDFVGGLTAIAVCFISSTITYIVPSVSLEGKSIWIIQSLPVKPYLALKAKIAFQLVLSLPLALVTYICSMFAFSYDWVTFFVGMILIAAFNVFIAYFGLFLSIKMCNLDWVNETVPIKQGLNVGLFMLFGVVSSGAIAAAYFLLSSYLPGWATLGCFALILSCSVIPLCVWARGKGSNIYSEL